MNQQSTILDNSSPTTFTVYRDSWPILAMYILSSLIGLSDICFAKPLGESAQAALGIAEQVIFITTLLGSGLCVAIVACVSKQFGATNLRQAKMYADQGLLAAFVLGLFATIFGVILAKPSFELFSSDPQILKFGVPYLQTCSLANLPFTLALCQSATFRSLGRPKYCLYQWLIISLVSIAVGALLFFLPSPYRLNLTALSYSWIAGSSLGVVLGFFLQHRCWQDLDWIDNKLSTKSKQKWSDSFRQLVVIALPATVSELILIGSNFSLYKLLSLMPNSAHMQAAWTASLKLEETFASMPLLAISLSTATIVGQQLGANRLDRINLTAKQAALGSAALMAAISTCLVLFCQPIAKLLSANQTVIQHISTFLKISPLLLPSLGLSLSLFGALEGAGCTHLPMIGNLLSVGIVRLALSWLLVSYAAMEMTGLVIALILSRFCLAASALYGYYRIKFADFRIT